MFWGFGIVIGCSWRASLLAKTAAMPSLEWEAVIERSGKTQGGNSERCDEEKNAKEDDPQEGNPQEESCSETAASTEEEEIVSAIGPPMAQALDAWVETVLMMRVVAQSCATTASASISTSASGVKSLDTSTIVVAGLMSPKNS